MLDDGTAFHMLITAGWDTAHHGSHFVFLAPGQLQMYMLLLFGQGYYEHTLAV